MMRKSRIVTGPTGGGQLASGRIAAAMDGTHHGYGVLEEKMTSPRW